MSDSLVFPSGLLLILSFYWESTLLDSQEKAWLLFPPSNAAFAYYIGKIKQLIKFV